MPYCTMDRAYIVWLDYAIIKDCLPKVGINFL